MMYRYFTKTDGLEVVIDVNMIMAVEDMGDFRVVITPYFEFEIRERVEEIFNDKKKFSDN
jgi:hypothetical protein